MSSAWSTPHSFQNPRSLTDARNTEWRPPPSPGGSAHTRHQSQAESFNSVLTGDSSIRTFDVAASFPSPPSSIPLPPPSALSQSTFRLSSIPSARTSFVGQSPVTPRFPSSFGGKPPSLNSSSHEHLLSTAPTSFGGQPRSLNSSAHPSHEDLLSTAFIQASFG